MLGDKIKATIKAKYYFGSPVIDAKVKYKVLRSSYSGTWYPMGRWDWLYGPGYWWFACDYPWYPGWSEWGCKRPAQSWWWHFQPQQQPEVVAEREVPIGADGTVEVEIDTAVAKLIHPDQDHQYTIMAEVVDQSRRTIVGQGNVLVAQAVQGVCVGRSGLLSRRRFDTCRNAGANARPQSGARRWHDSPVQNRL